MEVNIDDINISGNKPENPKKLVELAQQLYDNASGDKDKEDDALHSLCEQLANLKNVIRKESDTKEIAKIFGVKVTVLSKAIKEIIAIRNSVDDDPNNPLPTWADPDVLYESGFVQLFKAEPRWQIGIYFSSDDSRIKRVTNFAIRPVLHIYELSNNRRIVEVTNGAKTVFVEMPSKALVAKDLFETVLIERGNFTTLNGFERNNFKRLAAWLSDEMPICYELKSLGWQPEGFFAMSNKVWHNGEMVEYNHLGVITLDDKHYISIANSSLQADTRDTENPYENDAYLKYVKSKIDWSQWSNLFKSVYGQPAITGITYVFISLFKDIVTATTKCPILFNYGPKGSGKSDFAESLLYLFFSGKSAEGKLAQAINLNPGQITKFAFFNYQERFANCPGLYNEFDENRIEDWVFGALKSFYDGEGRVVGDGDTGKARKTKTQKTRGTMIVMGQYLSTADDGSVLSRSIINQFNLSTLKTKTQEQLKQWEELKAHESKGLSSIIIDLLKYREHFSKSFKTTYWEQYEKLRLNVLDKRGKMRPETRLLRNYAMIPAIYKIMLEVTNMPYTYDEVMEYATSAVAELNNMLKDNNALAKFWKVIQSLYDDNKLNFDPVDRKEVGTDFVIKTFQHITIKVEGEEVTKRFGEDRRIIIMRFSTVYQKFAVAWRSINGKAPADEGTFLKYLQDQEYYVGLVPKLWFNKFSTSGFAFDYDILSNDLNLERMAAEEAASSTVKSLEDEPPY